MARDMRQDATTAELGGFAWTPDRFNARVRALPMPRAGAVPSEMISLAYGMPDPALFPAAGLAAAAEEGAARRGIRRGAPVRERRRQPAPAGRARAEARGRSTRWSRGAS